MALTLLPSLQFGLLLILCFMLVQRGSYRWAPLFFAFSTLALLRAGIYLAQQWPIVNTLWLVAPLWTAAATYETCRYARMRFPRWRIAPDWKLGMLATLSLGLVFAQRQFPAFWGRWSDLAWWWHASVYSACLVALAGSVWRPWTRDLEEGGDVVLFQGPLLVWVGISVVATLWPTWWEITIAAEVIQCAAIGCWIWGLRQRWWV